MIKKNFKEVEEETVTKENSAHTTIRWLITREDGAPRFTMRRFKILPGGEIGMHQHPEEHEIYILEGEGKVVDQNKNIMQVSQGDVLYVPPQELHGYKNDGEEPFVFLCVIPYLDSP
ncbi:MAG: cupin domain-containing protein [Promethearchaeia archaeon]